MKKGLLLSLLGISTLAPIESVNAQGRISLYNYNAGGVLSPITWGATGEPIPGAWGYTVGMYYYLGDVVAAANASMTGDSFAAPGAGMAFATGPGSTTPLGDSLPGQYSAATDWIVPGSSGSVSELVTIVVVAYWNAPNYINSSTRGHSQAFLMSTAVGSASALATGDYMDGFAIMIPEPTPFALAALGLSQLVLSGRRQKVAAEDHRDSKVES